MDLQAWSRGPHNGDQWTKVRVILFTEMDV
jgi:hypothetical protein